MMMNKNGELRLPLATLTTKGVRLFREFVSSAPGMKISVAEKAVLEIASGAATANRLSDSVTVPLSPHLSTRHDTATLVMHLLNDAGIDAGPSSGHDNLFSWLALIFLPSLCRRTKAGNIATGQMYRYVLSRSTSDFGMVQTGYCYFRSESTESFDVNGYASVTYGDVFGPRTVGSNRVTLFRLANTYSSDLSHYMPIFYSSAARDKAVTLI